MKTKKLKTILDKEMKSPSFKKRFEKETDRLKLKKKWDKGVREAMYLKAVKEGSE